MNTKVKKKQSSYSDKNPLEALKGVGSGIVDSAVNDFAKQGVSDLWEQLLGSASKDDQHAGDLEEGQELDLKKSEKRKTKEHVAPAINYHHEIVEAEKRAGNENQREIHSKIQEILVELKKISEASSEIAMEFKEITIEQRIEKPGEYHVSFFQWMLSVIRAARAKIEDSGAWMNTMKSKKGQKNYWNMFKKHGTSFGLSNERVVATQVG